MVLAVVSLSCGRSGGGAGNVHAAEPKPLRVSTGMAVSREVAVAIQANGSFMADATSEVAPLSAGRVMATPVDVGAWVNEGDVIARLDDRDARLRLEQARAVEQQTEAALRQSRMRIGLGANATFDPRAVPEVQAAFPRAITKERARRRTAPRRKRMWRGVSTMPPSTGRG
jgi:multidrug efflux pump subunit AcrA (membrane-fusion protein)